MNPQKQFEALFACPLLTAPLPHDIITTPRPLIWLEEFV